MASVKKGFSFGSARTAGDGAGDCDQGDGGACSYSSYRGVGGLGSWSSKHDAIVAAFSAELFLARVGPANMEESLEMDSDRCFLGRFVESAELGFDPCCGSVA